MTYTVSFDNHFSQPRDVTIYAKQVGDSATLCVDYPPAIRNFYVGTLLYFPGVTYQLTHRGDPTVQPKAFRVLGYYPLEASGSTDVPAIELIVRPLNPYTYQPYSQIKRYLFPECLAAGLSPELWKVEVINPPLEVLEFPDAIQQLELQRSDRTEAPRGQARSPIPKALPIRPTATKTAAKHSAKSARSTSEANPAPRSTVVQSSQSTPAPSNPVPKSTSSKLAASIVSIQKQSPARRAELADSPAAIAPLQEDEEKQVDFPKTDTHRVREILKRWVSLSEATQTRAWTISVKQSDRGFMIRDGNGKVLFDLDSTEKNKLGTTQSALVLQEMMTQIVLQAIPNLSLQDHRQLLVYAQEVLGRLQTAPLTTSAEFMRYLFNLKAPPKRVKRSV